MPGDALGKLVDWMYAFMWLVVLVVAFALLAIVWPRSPRSVSQVKHLAAAYGSAEPRLEAEAVRPRFQAAAAAAAAAAPTDPGKEEQEWNLTCELVASHRRSGSTEWLRLYTCPNEPGELTFRVEGSVAASVIHSASLLREFDLMHTWNGYVRSAGLTRLSAPNRFPGLNGATRTATVEHSLGAGDSCVVRRTWPASMPALPS